MAKGDIVVLDLDGVLVHLDLPTERIRSALRNLFAKHGVHRDFKPLLQDLQAALDELAKKDASLVETARQEAWQIINVAEIGAAERAKPRPGLEDFMRGLEDRPLALYSNNCSRAITAALNKAGISLDRFFCVQGRDGDEPIKPAADPLIKIIQSANAQSKDGAVDRIFYVGDHSADMRSATMAQARLGRECEIIPIGLLGGRGDLKHLDADGAWFIANDLHEAKELIVGEKSSLSLSVVLLAYNEEALIGSAIQDVRRFCQLYAKDYEIIVVNDGSADGTVAAVEKANEGDVKIFHHPTNLGMGASMRDGYQLATKDYIAHLAGDRQVRAHALIHFIKHATPNRIVTSRYKKLPSGVGRKVMSVVFRLLVHRIARLKIDFAGTYLFHREIFKQLPGRQRGSHTFLYSFELLQQMADLDCEFKQVEITPFAREVGGSRAASIPRILKLVREMQRIRKRSSKP